MQDITIAIGGMSCGHCLNAVNRALAQIPGLEVKSVQIGRAELRVAEPAQVDQARRAVEAAGYKIEGVLG